MKFVWLLVASILVGVLKATEVGPTDEVAFVNDELMEDAPEPEQQILPGSFEYATLVRSFLSRNRDESDSTLTSTVADMFNEHTALLADDQLEEYAYFCRLPLKWIVLLF